MAKKTFNTSGKRKTAIARATIKEGKGRVRINSKPIEIYEPAIAKAKIQEPLSLFPKLVSKLDINIKVKGGGVMGQADAVRTAIARGILEFNQDEKVKGELLAYDPHMLADDPRRKEPKKQLGRGARKKRQKSYR
ncbi:MAG TPA: 30S ribosomal protein S9 [Thermoplasmata archaeon]|jgi:small subunit ribosomal protein S9|nr:30S ribosomal protein S9 [Thermoplasmata archaeon]HIH97525.1 30S ribosomal protein S9 [Thermoplasmata archaeon]